jgi:hypothetical protein
MLPVGILDGKKVLAWNPAIFGILIVLGFGALIASLSVPDFFSLFL